MLCFNHPLRVTLRRCHVIFMFSRKQKSILFLEGVLVIFSVIGSCLFVYQDTKAPGLPQQLYLSTSATGGEYTAIMNDSILPGQLKVISDTSLLLTGTSPGAPIETPKPSITPYPTPTRSRPLICNGPPHMMVLVVGIDRRSDGYDYGLADVVRVARIDFLTGAVTTLTLPRDLWVDIPGLEQVGISEGKLTQVYYYGSEYYGAYDDPDYGPGLMVKTLAENYGLQIDRYITVNMLTFEKIIDTIGGVDIYVPYDVDGKSIDPEDPFDLGFFPAGDHHFDGETAVRFARIRMMDNDYYRTTRQSMILKAIWKKLVTPEILPKVPQLISLLSGSVRMSLEAKDIQSLVCLLPLLDDSTLTFVNIPLEMLKEDRIFVERIQNTVFVNQVDPVAFKGLIRDFQRGLWPTPEP